MKRPEYFGEVKNMNINKWSVNINFETNADWKPLDTACWTHCPLACLTKLSEKCHAKDIFDKYGDVICPIVRFGHCDQED
jgi:hypothetical protein